jgi:L-ascorbate metabolism protein UlaG (beta-lactamase superfamily)
MIIWLGHAAFRIAAAQRIYIDPARLAKDAPPADIIAVTHAHAGHCSLPDIEKIVTSRTIVIGNAAVGDRLKGIAGMFRTAAPGDILDVNGVRIETYPAYGEGHPRAESGMGYLVDVEGQRIYHAGDCGLMPEMRDIRCEVALLPVAGGTVLSAEEADEACCRMRPALAIPMHYGAGAGTFADAQRFLCRVIARGMRVKLLTPQ